MSEPRPCQLDATRHVKHSPAREPGVAPGCFQRQSISLDVLHALVLFRRRPSSLRVQGGRVCASAVRVRAFCHVKHSPAHDPGVARGRAYHESIALDVLHALVLVISRPVVSQVGGARSKLGGPDRPPTRRRRGTRGPISLQLPAFDSSLDTVMQIYSYFCAPVGWPRVGGGRQGSTNPTCARSFLAARAAHLQQRILQDFAHLSMLDSWRWAVGRARGGPGRLGGLSAGPPRSAATPSVG